jgi:hypothetical protein
MLLVESVQMHSKLTKIIFSAKLFTAVNPSHYADVSITLARFYASILLMPVIKGAILVKIALGIHGLVVFFVCDHVFDSNHGGPRQSFKLCDRCGLNSCGAQSFFSFSNPVKVIQLFTAKAVPH